MQANSNEAMREALVLIANTADCLEASLRRDNVWDGYIQDAGNIRNIARHALALPRRQCDVGTAEEQAERFAQYCREHDSKRFCGDCPNRYIPKNCGIFWAQMPYEKEGDAS